MYSEIKFATFANYSSRGSAEPSENSRKLCGRVKSGDKAVLDSLAQRLRQPVADPIRDFLVSDRVLVPTPGSGRTAPGNLWVPSLICDALRSAGFGSEVSKLLRRETAVPKSAFAAPGSRPTPRVHYESMRTDETLYPPSKITLVDDVVTKGSTTTGAFLRLREAFPEADIVVFSVFRTCNLQPEIAQVLDPKVGVLRYHQPSDSVNRID